MNSQQQKNSNRAAALLAQLKGTKDKDEKKRIHDRLTFINNQNRLIGAIAETQQGITGLFNQ